MRRYILFTVLVFVHAAVLLASNVDVVTVNDRQATFFVSNITKQDRGENREALTLAIDQIATQGEVQLKYQVNVVNKDGACKGKLRYTRSVEVGRDRTATLQVYLRGMENGDRIFILPLGSNGVETDEQHQVVANATGTDDTCLQLCDSMLIECFMGCFPHQVCYYCDAPTCALMDCYCPAVPECPGPYRLYP